MTVFFIGSTILNHAKDFFGDEYDVNKQIEKFNDMTLIALSALKRENTQLKADIEYEGDSYRTQYQAKIFNDFDIMITDLYPIDTQDAYFNPKKYDENKDILKRNRALMSSYFINQNKYKTNPEHKEYSKYNDALNLAIKKLSTENNEKTKFNKKIYDNTEILCECGAHSYRKVLARHRKSALHVRNMEKLIIT